MSLKSHPFISLRTRFMALAVLLTLASSAIWGAWTWSREKELLYQRLSSEGKMLVSTMAIPIINALLYEELGIIKEGGLLDNFVADIMGNHQINPLYAMVLDVDGRVLAHNRLSEYGEVYDDPLSRSALQADGYLERPTIFAGKRARDLAMPLAIAGKRWGCLRVGLSMEPLHRDLKALGGSILGFSIFFSLVGMAVFFVVGRRLASPIVRLAGAMESMDSNEASYLPQTVRRDEIGDLERSFHDMLERLKRSEQEKRRTFEKITENERLVTVGKLVSGIAHEVNNPLSGIEGALYHIRGDSDERVVPYVEAAQQGVERIGRIVGQLLDLTRADELETEPVDSTEFFAEVALFAKMALKDKPCRLMTEDLCPPHTVHLDRDRIHQAVLNLVLNAADAVPWDEGLVRLEAVCRDEEYAFRVIDNGPGISRELQKMIFEPFFTTKEAGKGTGMGLAISRTIAERLGGRLECKSAEGEGTIFTLWLHHAAQSEKFEG